MKAIRHANQNFFLEQWDRTVRWFNSIEYNVDSLNKGKVKKEDMYLAFFINAYHLKDWLYEWALEKNEIKLANKLDMDFKENVFLRDLEIVCNGAKHYKLSNQAEFTITIDYSMRYIIIIGSNFYLMTNFVSKIMNYWENFIITYKLDQLSHIWARDLLPNPKILDQSRSKSRKDKEKALEIENVKLKIDLAILYYLILTNFFK